ncbi:hypothetical protein CAP38_08080 [Hydrogenophaga sp. IBVHS2]|nr:hypothetical protein CAP38_08080 [Hydrogenophaga sp. IBVHS2]
MSVGTAATAALNAASLMPTRAISPARSNSLFFTDVPSAMARVLSSSMAAYSVLGMVKLSRTSLGLRGADLDSDMGPPGRSRKRRKATV